MRASSPSLSLVGCMHARMDAGMDKWGVCEVWEWLAGCAAHDSVSCRTDLAGR